MSGDAKFWKDRSLRVLDRNPVLNVAGPDEGIEKQKPFLRPAEIEKLLSCKDVPVERREVYAVAIFTAMRQGELRALRVRAIDFEAMQTTVSRTLKDGVEKDGTKNGRARVVNIEPNLLPLLRVLVKGKKPEDHVLHVNARNGCASNLREDPLTAGCDRPALHHSSATLEHLKFHNPKDTCGTHMAVRRDPPQDIEWRLGHTTPAMTEHFIANARYEAGANFGEPLGPPPKTLLDDSAPAGVEPDEPAAAGPATGPVATKRRENWWRRRESKPSPSAATRCLSSHRTRRRPADC